VILGLHGLVPRRSRLMARYGYGYGGAKWVRALMAGNMRDCDYNNQRNAMTKTLRAL
jgi:hypothetical protein